jgi:hypothetical protein
VDADGPLVSLIAADDRLLLAEEISGLAGIVSRGPRRGREGHDEGFAIRAGISRAWAWFDARSLTARRILNLSDALPARETSPDVCAH